MEDLLNYREKYILNYNFILPNWCILRASLNCIFLILKVRNSPVNLILSQSLKYCIQLINIFYLQNACLLAVNVDQVNILQMRGRYFSNQVCSGANDVGYWHGQILMIKLKMTIQLQLEQTYTHMSSVVV